MHLVALGDLLCPMRPNYSYLNMKNISTVFSIIAAFTMFSGCTPEETFVAVNATALKKAASGELATAKVEMVFDIQNKDDLSLPGKIRRAALPYLGEGAVIEVEKTEKRKVREGGSIREDSEVEVDKSLDGAKLVARFNIPVGTDAALMSAPRSILYLKYTTGDKTFRLVHGNNISSLNSALSDVNSSVEFEYDGGSSGFGGSGTTIKIVNDANVTIGVAAAKVNGNNIIAGSMDTSDGALKICYDNGFYSGVSPCFTFGGFQSMKAVPLKKKSSWDDD